MFRLNFWAGLCLRWNVTSRFFLLLSLCWMTMNAHSSAYMTEVSTTVGNAYVELFNSADTVVSMKGWKMKCGSDLYEFGLGDKIAAKSLLVIDLKSTFFRFGNMVILINNEDSIVDQFAIGNLGVVREGESYQRDTVAILFDKVVKEDESPILLGKCTKGYLPLLQEVDRCTVIYKKDPINPNVSHGTFPVTEFSVMPEKNDPLFGESSVSEQHIIVSPNPCQTTLSVTYTQQERSHYQLSDVAGRVVTEGDIEGYETLDMSRYEVGVYMLTIGNETIKIEKK